MPKNSKRGNLGSLNVFTNRKLQKMQGHPLIEFENFRKKVASCRKKTQRGNPLVSPLLLEAQKISWFSARIEPTISCFSEN